MYYQYRLKQNLPDLTNQPNTYGLYQKKIQHVITEKNLKYTDRVKAMLNIKDKLLLLDSGMVEKKVDYRERE